MNYTELDRRLVQVVPNPRQFAYQQLEFYAFVHFTVNTFTGREWGDGTEDPAIFNPQKLDARQWARAVKSAGIDPSNGKELFYAKDGSYTYDFSYDDEVICGNTRPDVEGVIGSSLNWKGFSLEDGSPAVLHCNQRLPPAYKRMWSLPAVFPLSVYQ